MLPSLVHMSIQGKRDGFAAELKRRKKKLQRSGPPGPTAPPPANPAPPPANPAPPAQKKYDDWWDDSGDSEYEEPPRNDALADEIYQSFLVLRAKQKACERESDEHEEKLKQQRADETAAANAAAEMKKQERLAERERMRADERERRARERAASPHSQQPDANDLQRDFEDYLATHQAPSRLSEVASTIG